MLAGYPNLKAFFSPLTRYHTVQYYDIITKHGAW